MHNLILSINTIGVGNRTLMLIDVLNEILIPGSTKSEF